MTGCFKPLPSLVLLIASFATTGPATAQPISGFPLQESPSSKVQEGTTRDGSGFLSVRVATAGAKDGGLQPIVGASVELLGLRCKDTNGWLDVPNDFEQLTIGQSDSNGTARVYFPKVINQGANVHLAVGARLYVSHPEFVSQRISANLTEDTVHVSLLPGCKTAFTAVDEAGKPAIGFGAVIAGPQAPKNWSFGKRGELVIHSVAPGTWQTLLVKPQPDGLTLFSDLFLLPAQTNKTLTIRDMRLLPGISISGKLPDEVPRPIANGQIIAVSLPRPAKEIWDELAPSLLWHERVSISANGSFAFPSLPRSGRVQLIAMCDGWISSTNNNDTGLIMGQQIELMGDDVVLEPEMERTGSVKIQVRDETGKPIENAIVSVRPRQQYLRGDSAYLGSYILSSVELEHMLGRLPVHARSATDELRNCYVQRTGQTGDAVLTEIPIGRSQQIDVDCPGYTMHSNDRWIRLDARTGLSAEYVLTLSRSSGASR